MMGIKFKGQQERYKIAVMAILVAICCFLTYYFHAILETSVIFTHFFYVPIILACIWWKRKGLGVAIFLAVLLILSSIFVRASAATVNDCLRALMFIVIAFVVIILREQISKALKALKKEKNFSKNIIATVPESLVVLDKDLRIKSANRTFYETFQTEPDKVTGSSIAKILGDKDGRLSAELARLFGTEAILENFELFYRSENLDERVFNITARGIIIAEEGGGGGGLVVIRDRTVRKREEEALRNSEALLVEAQAVAKFGSWEYDVAKDKLTWSKEMFRIFDLDPALSEPKWIEHRQSIHPEDFERIDQAIRDAIENGLPYREEFRIVHHDGSTVLAETIGKIHRSESGKISKLSGTVQDITERKRIEKELLRSQKLESVGLLAGGIAHDFNNILTVILGNVSLAMNQITPDGEIFDLLKEAETASARAHTLTRQLLTFAKGGTPVKKTASIKDILKESSSFMLRGSKSSCEFSIAEDLWPAEVDVGQMSQVTNNIVINANQAMPNGGIIQVAAENLIIDKGQGFPLKPGRYIRVSIKDQGIGIAEKHLANIFDPYFTTKQEGSGLGLAVIYSIIKKHNGHITVESRLGAGTTFNIYLPASEKAVPEKEEEVRLIKGQGRILVMDDESSLRKMIGIMLVKLGYESEVAKDGAEAIDMYKAAIESGKPYNAVILDLTIPGGMGGKEAINKLLEIDPEVKAIVSSGYSNDPVMANFQEYSFKGMMPKPFEPLSLGKVLHEVLQGEIE